MSQISLQKIQSNDLEATELQGRLLAKNIKLKESGFNSKVFHYLKMNGLLSTVEKGKWANISFIEYLWLKVLETMRNFGCSLKLMQKLHYDLFVKAFEENLGKKTLKENVEAYKKIAKARPLNEDEATKLRLNEQFLNDPFVEIVLRTEISYFYQSVIECINYNYETGLVIYPDDTYAMFSDNSDQVDLKRPHIFIPFSHFISDLFHDEDKFYFIERLRMYDHKELQLIKELRSKNVDKVTITFDRETKQIAKVEYDKSGLIDGDKAKEVMRILGLRNYSGIKLTTRNGTTLSYTQTQKKFIE